MIAELENTTLQIAAIELIKSAAHQYIHYGIDEDNETKQVIRD